MKEPDPMWEVVAISSLIILIARTRRQFSAIPHWVTWVHFGIVSIYSLIGIAGLRFLLLFAVGHHSFVQMFSQSMVSGITPGWMQVLAALFGAMGSVLFVDVILLGSLTKNTRATFRYIVLPCSVLYPPVMLTACQATPSSLATSLAVSSASALFALGVFAILFYGPKSPLSSHWGLKR